MWWSARNHQNMEEPEQWPPEVEEVEEEWLNASATIVANGHRLDNSGDVTGILGFDDIGANIDGTANGLSISEPGDFPGFYPLPESIIATEEDDTTIDMVNELGDFTAFYPYSIAKEGEAKVVVRENDNVGELIEEEVVELEFEKVKSKLTTHSMHCPNCMCEITKVILRRKVLSIRPGYKQPMPEPYHLPQDLLGCFSFLSLFTCSDNGCFNTFEVFRRRETTTDPAILSSEEGKAKVVVREKEILKSIVYGGLMEVIASLSVVASAAASDATTLFIISVALASLMGGIFVIGHNLWDLRDDCYKDSSNNKAVNKYKELLGQVNHFPLHVFFTILSFLVFGMIPPVAYAYSFHETNDKDFTIAAVATASLICVALLAIFKAYINKCTVFDYFKTVVYYVTTAVSVSGVSYVAGNLVTRLMEEYGLFGPSSGGGMSFFPDAAASLASF